MVKVSQEDFNAAMDRVKKYYKALREECPDTAYSILEGMCVGFVSLYGGEGISDDSVLLMAETTAVMIRVDAE